jgi:hypothetical protein
MILQKVSSARRPSPIASSQDAISVMARDIGGFRQKAHFRNEALR